MALPGWTKVQAGSVLLCWRARKHSQPSGLDSEAVGLCLVSVLSVVTVSVMANHLEAGQEILRV